MQPRVHTVCTTRHSRTTGSVRLVYVPHCFLLFSSLCAAIQLSTWWVCFYATRCFFSHSHYCCCCCLLIFFLLLRFAFFQWFFTSLCFLFMFIAICHWRMGIWKPMPWTSYVYTTSVYMCGVFGFISTRTALDKDRDWFEWKKKPTTNEMKRHTTTKATRLNRRMAVYMCVWVSECCAVCAYNSGIHKVSISGVYMVGIMLFRIVFRLV